MPLTAVVLVKRLKVSGIRPKTDKSVTRKWREKVNKKHADTIAPPTILPDFFWDGLCFYRRLITNGCSLSYEQEKENK